MRPHLLPALLLIAAAVGLPATAQELTVGAAAVDVTPDYPVRLSGFGFRRAESEGVTQKIWAKALAIGGGDAGPAVTVTVDNLGIPISMTREVGARLAQKARLDPARLAITASHTHTAPMLTNVCPTLFGVPIPPEHQAHIDRYTKELTDALEKAALDAIADMKPARVEFGVGTADLAANRRTKGGPVDHDLPVLVVRDQGGKPRAVYVSYACHCVTLSNNKVSGDWAGFVQEAVQKNYPGAVCLTSVGCGADSNPASGVTGDKVDIAAAQGQKIAAEVDRLLKQPLSPITRPVETKTCEVGLLFDALPTRQQWEEKARRQDAVGYAVVLGGGVVMGASDRGHWPAERVARLLANDAELQGRWRRAVDLAAVMADDEKVPTPTRYDALRMLAARPWAECGPRLSRYLAKGTHDELQAGATSATGDVDAPEATVMLLRALPHLSRDNRNLALDALLRNRRRADALAREIESGAVERTWLDEARARKLEELRRGR